MNIRLFLYLLLLLPLIVKSQNTRSMQEVEQRQELSMSEVSGKTNKGVYRYYAIGASVPYTGILYAEYPNGQISSWQEYEDGVGQGQWINYYENGNYKEIGHYEQNSVEGGIQKFHSNGVLQAKGTYKDWRIKIGKWEYYDDKGSLLKTEDYGERGNIEEVQAYFKRGEISYSWYAKILSDNGF
jgi:antitoxin component YwqK of YwqJK toxin-antitoxin module